MLINSPRQRSPSRACKPARPTSSLLCCLPLLTAACVLSRQHPVVSLQVAGALYRLFAMLDGPEALLHPAILLTYLGHKLLQHMPGPLRQLLQPWGVGSRSYCVGSGRGGDCVGRVAGGDREAALAQLMGWNTA